MRMLVLIPVVLSVWAGACDEGEGGALYTRAIVMMGGRHNLGADLQTVLGLLHESADKHSHVPSIEMLADISVHGNFTGVPDLCKAKRYYETLAARTLSAKAHFYLAWIEDEGLTGPREPEKALVHLLLSASDNHLLSLVALGQKYSQGINVMPCCDTAVYLYYRASKEIIKRPEFAVYPNIVYPRVRIDGDGAEQVSRSDIAQYYDMVGRRDPMVLASLGTFYYFGAAEAEIDHAKAREYFETSAADGVGDAYGYLGDMHRHGHGVERDYTKALEYYHQGADFESQVAWNGLGIMHLNGLGVPNNTREAVKHFAKAADQGYPDAKYHLGRILAESRSHLQVSRGLRCLKQAAKSDHFPALFEYSQCLLKSQDQNHCHEVSKSLKRVVERGVDHIVQEALRDHREGRREASMVKYMLASYLGHEMGHMNAAHLLEKDGKHRRAFVYLQRASRQGNLEARIRVGDCHYYGHGVPLSCQTAATVYREAEALHSPHAAFNLGYMHECGIGVERDLELARAYYERSVQHDPLAQLPASLALARLYIKTWMSGAESGSRRGWMERLGTWEQASWWVRVCLQWLLMGAVAVLCVVYGARVYRQGWNQAVAGERGEPAHQILEEQRRMLAELRARRLAVRNVDTPPVNDSEPHSD